MYTPPSTRMRQRPPASSMRGIASHSEDGQDVDERGGSWGRAWRLERRGGSRDVSDGVTWRCAARGQVQELFKQAGFRVELLETHKRLVRNRKEGYNMHRRWVQGTFVKNADTVSL